jgi:hypothetical protein
MIGDTVRFRNAKGKTMNLLVLGTQAQAGAVPAAPVVANATTGGTLAIGTFSYRISRVKNGAETLASTAGTTTTTTATSTATVTLPGVANEQYAVYGRVGGSEAFLGLSALGAVSFVDTGAVAPAGAVPVSDGRIAAIAYHLPNPSVLGTPGSAIWPLISATGMKQINRYFWRN